MICVNRMGGTVLRIGRFRKTTDSNHSGLVAANLLDQNFACDRPNQEWGVDISYIWTAEGWGLSAGWWHGMALA